MAKITVTYEFDNEDEVRAHFALTTRTETAPITRAAVPQEAILAAAAAPVVNTPAAVAPVETRADDEGTGDVVTADVDGDGLPYDPEIHADPKSFTAGGLWRSKRGKSKEADQRRADFKAAGGKMTAPTMPTIPTGMPGMPLPTAETRAEPITFEVLLAKAHAMMTDGKIDASRMIAMYGELGVDPNSFPTNESARASMYDALVKLEG
jgi:hypothetical protein